MINQKFLIKLTEKWPVKVLSVAAALILSIFYKLNTLENRYFSVPLRIESTNELVPASLYPHIVRVDLRGEPNSIFPIPEEDIEAYVNLNRYTSEGSYRIPIQIRKKGSSIGVEPLEITVKPIEIYVKLENKTRAEINVSPVFNGFVAQGYELTGYSIYPPSVIAEGPRSIMEEITEFNTGIIDLEGRYENFTVMINIINTDPLITIHGSRMVEYHGNIRRIPRAGGTPFLGEVQE